MIFQVLLALISWILQQTDCIHQLWLAVSLAPRLLTGN